MMTILAYLLLGGVAGLLAGLLGIGGGIIIVPALFFLYHWQDFPAELSMHMAIGSSLAIVVFTSIASTYAHHRRGAVLWTSVARLVPGIVIGALLGATIADYLSGRALRVCFGVFELFVGAQLVMEFKLAPHRLLAGNTGMAFTGVVVGSVSTVLGIGGGTLTVPFLLWRNVAIRQAVATSAACGLPIALAGSIGFMVMGWDNTALPAWSSGYVYWPAVISVMVASVFLAPVGAWLTHTLPVTTLKRLFAIIVVMIGVRMLI